MFIKPSRFWYKNLPDKTLYLKMQFNTLLLNLYLHLYLYILTLFIKKKEVYNKAKWLKEKGIK